MKKITCSFLFLVAFIISSIAQVSASIKLKTGDSDLDVDLNEMNIRAKADLKLFNHDLSVTYNVKEKDLDQLYIKFNMEPSDVFMTLELGNLTGKPINEIATVFENKKNKGWGEIAKELGIKPGSAEFHKLKESAKKNKDKKKSKPHKENGNPGKGKGKNKK
ncbi:MAG: hypothetical protein N3F09_07785 [Bacteroidia bacterium]|nr:hypothetical protein [Bacteroidia bacterium]